MKGEKSDWIFYLKLSKKLTSHFYSLDKEFKNNGITLVPITLSELLSVTKGEGKFHVITCIRGFSEASYYTKKVKKIFSYLVRSGRLNLFVTSSFNFINETHLFGRTGHYFYYQLPLKIPHLCDTISKEIDRQDSGERRWPGTSKGLGATVR